MHKEVIPVHHLPDVGPVAIGVERIVAHGTDVMNDVHRHDFHELFIFANGTVSSVFSAPKMDSLRAADSLDSWIPMRATINVVPPRRAAPT